MPTGKTPEYFIKWTMKFLNDWGRKETKRIMGENGFNLTKKHDLKRLRFVQMDKFHPISLRQYNIFYDYIVNF